jgi:hypothetical protein
MAKKGKDSATNLYLVGLDVGFGETKVVSSANKEIVFPSAVERGNKSTSGTLKLDHIDLDSLIVTTDNGTFHVGKQAMKINRMQTVSSRTLIRDRAEDERFRVLFQTAVALSLPDQSGEYDVYIVTGLPNDDYKRRIKDKLEAFITGDFTVEFHLDRERSIKKKVHIVDKSIIRQPEGSIMNNHFAFHPETLMTPTKDFKGRVGVIDIGHYTTDYALFEGGVIIENDDINGSTVATNEMYKKLKRHLSNYFDELGLEYEAPDEDLDIAVRTKKVTFMGEHDVSRQVEMAAREVAASIAKSVLDTWGQQANRQEAILLTGGGANIFAEYLKEEFEDRRVQNFIVIDNPQLSNVYGFYMHGTLQLLDKIDPSPQPAKESIDFVYEHFVKPVSFGRGLA